MGLVLVLLQLVYAVNSILIFLLAVRWVVGIIFIELGPLYDKPVWFFVFAVLQVVLTFVISGMKMMVHAGYKGDAKRRKNQQERKEEYEKTETGYRY